MCLEPYEACGFYILCGIHGHRAVLYTSICAHSSVSMALLLIDAYVLVGTMIEIEIIWDTCRFS